MKLLDKHGWPVVTFAGDRWIANFLRRVIHTNIRRTLKARFGKKKAPARSVDDCGSAA